MQKPKSVLPIGAMVQGCGNLRTDLPQTMRTDCILGEQFLYCESPSHPSSERGEPWEGADRDCLRVCYVFLKFGGTMNWYLTPGRLDSGEGELGAAVVTTQVLPLGNGLLCQGD